MKKILLTLGLMFGATQARAQFFPIPAGAVPFGDTRRNLKASVADIQFNDTNKQLLVGISASAALPGYSFPGTGNNDNGFYRSGTDEVSVSTAGVQRWAWQADGTALLVGVTSPSSPVSGSLWNDSDDKQFHSVAGGHDLRVGGTMFTQTASSSLASSTSETTILAAGDGSLTIPANSLSVGKSILVKGGGTISCTATPTLTLRFKFGGSNVIAQNLTPSAIDTGGDTENYCDTADKIFSFDVVCTVRSVGASGSVICSGGKSQIFSNNKAGGLVSMGSGSPVTINTTAAITLNFTGQWDASSADNEIALQTAVFEIK